MAKSKKNKTPRGINSSRALMDFGELPKYEYRALVARKNDEPYDLQEDLNDLFAEGWQFNQQLNTDCATVIILHREQVEGQ